MTLGDTIVLSAFIGFLVGVVLTKAYSRLSPYDWRSRQNMSPGVKLSELSPRSNEFVGKFCNTGCRTSKCVKAKMGGHNNG